MILVPELHLEKVIAQWLPPSRGRSVQELGSHGGLSGARLWKIDYQEQSYCLRQLPDRPPAERLAEIHGFLDHLQSQQCQFTPRVMRTLRGETHIFENGHAWELLTWLPGAALPVKDLQGEQTKTALETLATVHILADSLRTSPEVSSGGSRGIQVRDSTLKGLSQDIYQARMAELIVTSDSLYAERCQRMFAALRSCLPIIQEEVAKVVQMPLPLRWILGDVHREHLLFTGNEVTGLIDFGAVRVDSPMTDVARLLGSTTLDDHEKWTAGLTAYTLIRRISPSELATMAAFDAGGVAVAANRWLHWLLVSDEEISHLAPSAVQERLCFLTTRLEAMIERGRAGVLPAG
ncbi:phosphotransferase enzyme family protein [Adhaeretor mobilis]|uniref:Homoserine kinase n=1 Tax=Adhaeretor mobilis TaxID=1930276 RepID=A0A517MVL1_9BACT|nr:phosphotransferase [Adhaeretor mobilis]QDS98913.1 homoserine kinase [Adhaeretor mobilis]